jgi:hypothetical protein
MMEKRNVIEDGRTPEATVKIAEVVDEGVNEFMKVAQTPPVKQQAEQTKEQQNGQDK